MAAQWIVLCLLYLSLDPTASEGEMASGSGGGEGVICPNCPMGLVVPNCSVDFSTRNITCTVNTSPCDQEFRCSDDENCTLLIYKKDSAVEWSFLSICGRWPLSSTHDTCVLDRSYKGSTAFPPPKGLQCVCRTNCTVKEPLVYVHRFPPPPTPPTTPPVHTSSSLVSLVSPSVSPSPSPTDATDGLSSSLHTGYVAAGAILGALLIASVSLSTAFLLHCWWRKRCKHRRNHRRQGGRTSLQDITEDAPPFLLGHIVSRGHYGTVYRAEYEGELVAVKVFSHQNRASWENERTLFGMQSMKHRNVIDYIVGGMWGSGPQLQMFIVTPFFFLGSLNKLLARNNISWEQACRVIHSIASGLGHLHAESYVNSNGVTVEKYAVAHRDIKSANVLVRGENGDCVISDLGFAIILDPARDEKDMANTGQVGTHRYMAPEALDARINLLDVQSFKQIDIYALALVMWEVVWRCNVQQEENPREYLMAYEETVGKRPGIDTMRDVVCTQKLRPQILPAWRNHPGLNSLVGTMEECWDEDPEARLSARNVKLRLKDLLDGGPSSLASDHTPSHSFPLPPVVPSNEQYRVTQALESTSDTIHTTDSRPPPYDSRWSYAAVGAPGDEMETSEPGDSPSVSMELNLDETTV